MLNQIEAKALYSSDGFYQISEIVQTLSETQFLDLKRLFPLGRDRFVGPRRGHVGPRRIGAPLLPTLPGIDEI